MPWQTPKTTWVNGDIFDLDPDYNRIKGNIEYIIELAQESYPSLVDQNLGTYTINDFATETFFTDIVDAVTYIKTNTVTPYGWQTMRTDYSQTIWAADDLNTIERNIELLYLEFVPGKVIYLSGLYKAGQIPTAPINYTST